MTTPRIAIYCRVSTQDQNNALQFRELTEYVQRRGWELAGIYQDQASGAKVSRPGLDHLMIDARLRKFDAVAVWKLDRFGRSLVHCVSSIRELQSLVSGSWPSPRAYPAHRCVAHAHSGSRRPVRA